MEKEFEILVKNGWLSEKEAQDFSDNNELIECMNLSTSPKKSDIFNALTLVPFDKLKVVILGKDPYPNPKDAHGLAFSSKNSVTPDSLKNIFKSIDTTYGTNLLDQKYNELSDWAKQGVLLLNTALTFQKIQDESLDKKQLQSLQTKTQNHHAKIWRPFVKTIINKILTIKEHPTVIFLWGNDAHNLVFSNIKDSDFKIKLHSRKPAIVPNTSVMLLQTSHPSPLSVNTGGDFPDTFPKHLKICDKYLGNNKIDWNLKKQTLD